MKVFVLDVAAQHRVRFLIPETDVVWISYLTLIFKPLLDIHQISYGFFVDITCGFWRHTKPVITNTPP